MSESVKMPALGESVTEGTVSRWLVEVGEKVEADQPLLEVSTDKVDSEVPSPASGVLVKILVDEDETVEVGTELGIIGDEAEAEQTDTEQKTETAENTEETADKTADAPAESSQAETGSGETTDVEMPALGESVTEGTVSRWLVEVGDKVEADQPIVEVSTDKVDSEVPSPAAGFVVEILVAEDDTVEVGSVLARIGEKTAGNEAATKSEEQKAAPAPEAEQRHEHPAEERIPSSVSESGEKKVVQWAYPQADSGYPATMSKEGQTIPKAPEPPKVPDSAATTSASETSKFGFSAEGTGSYITPIVRKLAKDLGIDLSQVKGTGVGGRIRRADVEAAAAAQAEAAKAAAKAATQPAATSAKASIQEDTTLRGTTQKMSRLRQTISKRMVESLQVSAQLTTVVEVDVTKIAALRARAKDAFQKREGTKLTFLPFFVKAATEALKAHPKLNATIKDKEVVYHNVEHIGIAVDTPKGLFVPVIKDCGDLTIAGIAKRINDLAARTRDGKVDPSELSGSTFTITNTGSGGALFDTPIINQPEVGILGVGTIVKRPVVRRDADGNDVIAVRSMVYLAISYDHRLVDGADAARYLMSVKSRLEEGDFAAEVGL